MSYNIFSDLPRIAAALLSEPWLIEPGHHRSMVEQVEAHRSGAGIMLPQGIRPNGEPEDDKVKRKSENSRINEYTTYDAATGIGLLDIKGVIGKGLSGMAMDCGGCCLDHAEAGLDGLRAKKPKAVQLYLSTPGGTVSGVEEFADSLAEFAATVAPVHAYVDSLCCSAGEWIATGATTRHAAGSATLGSIGVYTALFDQTSRYAQAGVKVHLINTGPQKGAGYPGTEITADHLAAAQKQVNAIAADFFGKMSARYPNLDSTTHFTGGTFRAKSPEGMALHDGIVPSRRAHLALIMQQYAAAPARRLA